jgi:hypothetical protein
MIRLADVEGEEANAWKSANVKAKLILTTE